MRRFLLFVLFISLTTVSFAQDLPSPEEMQKILIEGPDWKVIRLKNQLLSERGKVDSTSVDFHAINIALLPTYLKLEDMEAVKETADDIYNYLISGGKNQLKDYCDVDQLFMQVTLALLTCYSDEGDYSKAEAIGNDCLSYAKNLDNYDYYTALLHVSEVQNKLGKNDLAYANIKKCYKSFNNTERLPGDATRSLINTTYFNVLRDLAIESVASRKYSRAKRYLKEINVIFKEYPETNTALSIDSDLLASIVEGMPDNVSIEEADNVLEGLMSLKHDAYLAVMAKYDEVDEYTSRNDFIAGNYLGAAQDAINQERWKASGFFLRLAEKYANNNDVSDTVREYVLDYRAYYDVQYSGDYFDALKRYEALIAIRKNTDKENLKTTYLNLLNMLERVTICNRYFFAHTVGTIKSQNVENYIPVLNTDDIFVFLDAWERIANDIIETYGKAYFNSLIYSAHYVAPDQRVFPFYSLEDNMLMKGHNYIRDKQYDNAFEIIRKLIQNNSLSNEKVKDLIWRIDNNLYLHSDYESSNSFLCAIEKSDIVTEKPDIQKWVANEKDRIKDWANYAIGYAQGLTEEGKIEEAMEQYDIVQEQVQRMEGRDSLLVLTNFYRAADLKSAGKFLEAIPYYKTADSLYNATGLKSFLYRHFTLNGLSWCYYNCKDLANALVYIDADCNYLESYTGDTGEYDYETEWHSAHKQRATIYLEQQRFDLAANQYLLSLKRLESRGIDSSDHEYKDIVCWVAQTYHEASIDALNTSFQGFLDYYDKAISFLDLHKDIEEAYYFINPLNDNVKDYIAKIDGRFLLDFCEKAIQFDNTRTDYRLQKGLLSEREATQQKAVVISQIAYDCLEANHLNEAIFYYNKGIDSIQKSIYSFDDDYLTLDYSMLSWVYQSKGEWEKAVDCRMTAFNTSVDFNGINHESCKDYFFSLENLISIALEASTSYVNAIYQDENHPHLDYETNTSILLKWRELLKSVKEKYGEKTINSLQEYCLNKQAESWRLQFGTDRPYFAREKLTYEAETYYTLCLLNIMGNRMADFTTNYKILLDQIVSIDPSENIDLLRYNIVMQMSESLSHAGYSDWSMEVLGSYWQYLVSEENHSFDYAEKVMSAIGFEAWRMMDVDRLIWATNKASLLLNKDDDWDYHILFYDVNELISQLILYSRVQAVSSFSDASHTLKYAQNLVDQNVSITGEDHLLPSTIATLYNECATITSEPRESVMYLCKVLDIDNNNNYTAQLNLAGSYSKLGEIEKSDSLLHVVYDYSREKYMEPRWKITMYKYLAENSLNKGNTKQALDYSKECLSVQIKDYLKASQALTSKGRNNYWDLYYNQTLEDATSVDYACGSNGENSYNAALFQKSILIRQKRSIKTNILQSTDSELKQAFERYNNELRAMSDSVAVIESYCMYLYSLHPEFVSTFKIPTWSEVKSSLRKDELAIEYSIAQDKQTGEAYYIAILLRDKYESPIIVRLCSRNELISAATEQTDDKGFPISLYQDCTLLYKYIWEPIKKYLNGVKTIYYAPYEYLNNINIEIASRKERGRSIGDTYTMFRVSTTAELVNTDNAYYTTATLFGSLDYNAKIVSSDTPLSNNNPTPVADYAVLRGSMGGSWSRLANTKREMEDIQNQLNLNNIRTTVYGEEKGTEEAFKGLSGVAPDIIHMATHGFYYSVEEAQNYQFFTSSSKSIYSSGLRSGLVLSGGNHAWNGESLPIGVEDGILTADEISGMDLTGTKMLTLSACQTALGDIASDGIYGMQRSFKVSGVNTLIMSLWQVDDEATYLMMDRFYQELTSGKEKHIAFRLAQLSIRPWAEKRVKELNEEIEKLPQEAQEKRIKQYGGRLYPEYYWGAFIMLD